MGMSTNETSIPNKFAGSCNRCGAKVAAATGLWSRDTGCVHTTVDDCNHTTKTWAKHINTEAFNAAAAARKAQWSAAGFDRVPEFMRSTASFESSVDGAGVVDGLWVKFIRGGGRMCVDDVTYNTIRVFSRVGFVGRFELDRAAIDAADVPGHEGSVTRNAEEIRQIVAGIRMLRESSGT